MTTFFTSIVVGFCFGIIIILITEYFFKNKQKRSKQIERPSRTPYIQKIKR